MQRCLSLEHLPLSAASAHPPAPRPTSVDGFSPRIFPIRISHFLHNHGCLLHWFKTNTNTWENTGHINTPHPKTQGVPNSPQYLTLTDCRFLLKGSFKLLWKRSLKFHAPKPSTNYSKWSNKTKIFIFIWDPSGHEWTILICSFPTCLLYNSSQIDSILVKSVSLGWVRYHGLGVCFFLPQSIWSWQLESSFRKGFIRISS